MTAFLVIAACQPMSRLLLCFFQQLLTRLKYIQIYIVKIDVDLPGDLAEFKSITLKKT